MHEFEWDDDKAAENASKHGVLFSQAIFAFRDAFAIEWIDQREDYGEERSVLLGMAEGHLLVIIFTERADRIRIISARGATRGEHGYYYRQNET